MFSFILVAMSLIVVIKSADYAVSYASKVAQGLRISGYMVGFLLIAVICALPETFISVTAALEGTPSLGLGTLFGSNVADLTLIFALVVLFSKRSEIKAESKIVKNGLLYIIVLSVPILLGLNGYFSRIDGVLLISAGIIFYTFMLNRERTKGFLQRRHFSFKYFILFLVSLAVLLAAADFSVKNALAMAHNLNINPVLVGMFIIALGTTLPELFLSIKAVRENHEGLAIGDILGNVITDATIVIGIVALISPFSFNQRIAYITGIFMVFAAIILFYLMRTGRVLTKKESFLLLFFYLLFILTEIIASNYFDYIGD